MKKEKHDKENLKKTKKSWGLFNRMKENKKKLKLRNQNYEGKKASQRWKK